MAFKGVAALIEAAGPQIKDVEVVFNGETSEVRVRQLSFREAGALNAKLLDKEGKVDTTKIADYREQLLSQTIVDENGKPAFTAEVVGSWPVLLVDEIEKAVRKANGLTETAAADTQKNS